MSFRRGPYAVQEDDWEIIGGDWWRTSFRDVPWSYVSRSATKAQQKSFHGPLFCNPSPRPTSATGKEHSPCDENDSVNVELVGARTALDAVVAYERDVGFYFTALADLQAEHTRVVDLSLVVDETDLVAVKKKWDDQLDDLMNGPAFDDTDSSSLSSSGELHRSTSAFSSLSSIDSIGVPSTPKPKASFGDVEIKDVSPSGSIHYPMSPTRSLNAAASSFVPTFCSQLNDEPIHFPPVEDKPKPAVESFSNFTFPTLNSLSPSAKGKKDDQAFFNDAASPEAGSGLLPAFMQEPSLRNRVRKSRTREIVDRLRSRMAPSDETSSQAQSSPKYGSHSPSPIGDEATFFPQRLSVSEDGGDRLSRISSPCEEDDGWIDISQPNLPSPNHKSKRARELLFALTRRRTDSLTPENAKEMTAEPPPQNVTLSPSPSPPLVTATDGWIESSPQPPAELQKKAKPAPTQNATHTRKKSSNYAPRTSSSSASHSHPHPHTHSHSQQQHPQFAPSVPGYAPHASGPLPHMLPTQMLPGPFFFPAYPAVSMPLPYTGFMQVPAYHLALSMQAPHIAPQAAAAMQYPMPLPPPLGGPLPAGAATNAGPAFRSKHSPLW